MTVIRFDIFNWNFKLLYATLEPADEGQETSIITILVVRDDRSWSPQYLKGTTLVTPVLDITTAATCTLVGMEKEKQEALYARGQLCTEHTTREIKDVRGESAGKAGVVYLILVVVGAQESVEAPHLIVHWDRLRGSICNPEPVDVLLLAPI